MSLPYHTCTKSYVQWNFEKVGKNHVPTCPIIAGPVTYADFNCSVFLIEGRLTLD